MPILNKAQAKKVLASKGSNSLHYSNETSAPAAETSGVEVENNMSVDTLIDPEDYEQGGDTHFNNEDASHPTLASAKRSKLKANGGSTVDFDTTNVGTIPNDVDPDQGYIGSSADGDEDPDADNEFDVDANEIEDDDEVDFGEVNATDTHMSPDVNPDLDEAADTVLDNSMSVNQLEAGDGDDADWDAPPPLTDDDVAEDDLADLEGEGDEEDVAVEQEDLNNEPEPEAAATGEDLSILDVDETPDEDVDGVAFAAAGTRLLCIKANRVIASMTGRMAIASGRNDVYLTDQFQQVTAMSIKDKGLRKGLKSMGFALATVNLGKQSVLKARVQKEVIKTTAAVRKVAADKEKAFQQSLAIASVGINRKMFKDVENPLKAHLEGEFRRIGIHGAGRILAHAFNEHGPAYAKQVIELANKIAAMPEEVRDGYVDMMDLQSGVMDEPDEDMVPIGADDSDVEDDEAEFENSDFGETIEAALARPGTRIKAHAAASSKYSVEANQILAGTRPLFSL